MSKREANKLANRLAIQDAALQVFCEIGYDAASISDIVNASGLSVGTFYNYYGDKESLLALLIDQILADSRAALHKARSEASSPESFIRDAFAAFVGVLKAQPDYLVFIKKNTHAFRQAINHGSELQNLFGDLEKDMQAAIDKQLLPSFPVKLMTAAMIGASIEVFSMANQQNESILANFLSTLFIGGIQKISQS